MTNKAEQTPSFEQDMAKLDTIVRQLEQGELALDDALKVFEEGHVLIKRCREKLAQTETQVEKIVAANMKEDA